ncbi:nuclease-related domain-containing protein [Microbacterium limosum]|uniref:Nuclease-related domain-containing protein n=1 Tax=Microbacterium limosum TaxID=3079935 RepID=A0AAU0MJR7_9MICO|nr:nuclease-related domain-containing protein [Microbacterium sp. Y20]WOQ70502.1 nuclease-related domain-containing protein [Microbacterium sp. Y20]
MTSRAVPGFEAPSDLRMRPPGASVIGECLRRQAASPPRSRLGTIFGRSPLSSLARPWYVGALGEIAVGRLLDGVGPGWSVLHAVPVGCDGGDIDHLLIGPAGVFTVTTLLHEGEHRRARDRDPLYAAGVGRRAVAEAARAARQLSAAAHLPIGVRALVVTVGARSLSDHASPEGVLVLRDRDLTRWLRSAPQVWHAGDVARISSIAARPGTWMTHRGEHADPVDVPAFVRLRRQVRRAAGTRAAWVAAGALAVPVAVAASIGAPVVAAMLP